MLYQAYLTNDGDFDLHKAGCAHIKRAKNRLTDVLDIDTFEADSAFHAIAIMHQGFFESAGGKGLLVDADPAKQREEMEFALQEINVINCAR